MKEVVFVLPTKNEEKSIEQLILSLRDWAVSNDLDSRVVVVDDSLDQTASIARRCGAKVLSGGRLGLGYAMYLGLCQAVKDNPDIIVSMDTDGQVDLKELDTFLDSFSNGDSDLLISSRFLNPELIKYRYPWVNYIGNRILVLILKLATRKRLTDSHGGIRMMHPEVVRKHWQIGKHTYVQETLIVAVRNGFRVKELPSVWLERKHGDSRVLHSIWRYVFRTSPALAFHLGLHWVFLGMSLVGFWYTIQFQSLLYFLLSGLLMLMALYLVFLPKKALRYVEAVD